MHGHAQNLNKKDKAKLDGMAKDFSSGFMHFMDELLRGRETNTLFNASLGLAALNIGVPNAGNVPPYSLPSAMMNNALFLNTRSWDPAIHPLFNFDTSKFTLFGLDFNDMWGQLQAGLGGAPYTSMHMKPIYQDNVATSMGLPDLPYGEIAHFLHMGMALYDTGRTFQDLWNDPALKHNVVKVVTHPEMLHTVAHWVVMLTVMGTMHMLGAPIAIGLAYLAGHLVHSLFGFFEGHHESLQAMKGVPILGYIYENTGLKEWAEAKSRSTPSLHSVLDREAYPAPQIRVELDELPQTEAGKSCTIRYHLVDANTGHRIDQRDLALVHEHRVHNMVINSSLTDYHHVHPDYNPWSGQFSVTFTPKTNEPYVLWTDVQHQHSRHPQFIREKLHDHTAIQVMPSIISQHVANGDGLSVRIEADPPLSQMKESVLRLTITDTQGRKVETLEPIMGAFAHLVGFSADGQHFLHCHPIGREPQQTDERAVGQLEFHVTPTHQGPTRFFLQVVVDGKERVVSFGQNIGREQQQSVPSPNRVHVHRVQGLDMMPQAQSPALP